MMLVGNVDVFSRQGNESCSCMEVSPLRDGKHATHAWTTHWTLVVSCHEGMVGEASSRNELCAAN